MLLTMGAFFLVGTILAGSALAIYWDEIKNWLNTVAADIIEKKFGYGARHKMHKAIAVVDRLVDKVKNTATIYTKKTDDDLYMEKTTIVSECAISEFNEEQLKEFDRNNNRVVQELVYKR